MLIHLEETIARSGATVTVRGPDLASSFVTRPVHFDTLVEVMKSIDRCWFETVELPA